MDEKQIPSLAEIHIAASHLRSIAVPITPIITNTSLNKLTGRNIYFKCENFQRTGSFRSRGALNAVLNAMKIDPNLKGFITYSSRNHGIAVAYAASLVQRACIVIISNDISKNKRDTMEYYGAELILGPSTSSNHIEMCLKISKERDFLLIPPSDHSDVIAGHGTIAVELLEQVSDLDAILVPVNDGGLISGIALYVKQINPDIRIYACVPEGKMLEECLTEGKRLWPDSPQFLQTKCQVKTANFFLACRSQQCGILAFPIMCSLIEKQVFTISDKFIIDATRFAFEHLKVVIELASGLPLAAILSQSHTLDSNLRNIAIILTSGNMDLDEPLPWQQD